MSHMTEKWACLCTAKYTVSDNMVDVVQFFMKFTAKEQMVQVWNYRVL